MSCPHCGSRSIPFSDVDREHYCMNCNRGEFRPLPPEPLLTDDMIEYPQHHKMVTFTCATCGKTDEKKRNSRRKICVTCAKKRNNDRQNRIKYKQLFYNSQERYPKMHECTFCGREIIGKVYKKRNVREWCCEKCYKAKFGRRGKNDKNK